MLLNPVYLFLYRHKTIIVVEEINGRLKAKEKVLREKSTLE